MAVQVLTDPDLVRAAVVAALEADPVRNTVYSSVLRSIETDGTPWCAVDGSAVAARGDETTPIALTERWTDVDGLAAAIGELDAVTSIGGPVDTVEALVGALGREPAHRTAEGLFRLDSLVAPSVPGEARLARDDDAAQLIEWYRAFLLEAWGALPPSFLGRPEVERGIAAGSTWIWVGPDGEAAMAVRHPVVHGVARIGPVYTPPDRRGHGYGSAVTAAATQSALEAPAIPVLYTDLANPTSNKIYQALGYYRVADRLSVRF